MYVAVVMSVVNVLLWCVSHVQVLSRDIRSVHQRLNVNVNKAPCVSPCASAADGGPREGGETRGSAAAAAVKAEAAIGDSAAVGQEDGERRDAAAEAAARAEAATDSASAAVGQKDGERRNVATATAAAEKEEGEGGPCGVSAAVGVGGGERRHQGGDESLLGSVGQVEEEAGETEGLGLGETEGLGLGETEGLGLGHYHVVLEGIDVHYDILSDGTVRIMGALPAASD
jgi:hypothetical protein